MKKITYHCNLCGEEKDKSKIIAFYFKSDTVPQKYVLDANRINDCDKHLCINCIKIIKGEES